MSTIQEQITECVLEYLGAAEVTMYSLSKTLGRSYNYVSRAVSGAYRWQIEDLIILASLGCRVPSELRFVESNIKCDAMAIGIKRGRVFVELQSEGSRVAWKSIEKAKVQPMLNKLIELAAA